MTDSHAHSSGQHQQTGDDEPITLDDDAVRHALESLYANVDLAGSPLADHLMPDDSGMPVVEKAQTLRNVLLDAIETLRPLNPNPPQVTTLKRSYDVLYLRYVSGLTISQIASRHSLGERQIYRDLRRAEENLTEVLEARTPLSRPKPESDFKPSVDHEDVSHLLSHQESVDLAELVSSALTTVRFLADQQGVKLVFREPQVPMWATITTSALRQVLVQLLSAMAQQGAQNQLTVRLKSKAEPAHICIDVTSSQSVDHSELLQDALQMIDALGFSHCFVEDADRTRGVSISVPVSQSLPVLVIEDNAGACELYRRYLQGSEWQPVVIDDLQQAEQTALAMKPCAVILDILMPDSDGWSILQAFKMEPNLADIPVIVCSVVSDPELANALGAAASLKKPLSRLELIGALKRIGQPVNR